MLRLVNVATLSSSLRTSNCLLRNTGSYTLASQGNVFITSFDEADMTTRLLACLCLILVTAATAYGEEPAGGALKIAWKDNYLSIFGDFPGKEMRTHYLEAYCRPGSTDRDWGETVIKHRAELLSASEDGRVIKLRDTLADGVIVEHVITAGDGEVDFRLTATNPTSKASQAHWAQPCIRVDKFTGAGREDARVLVPKYARQCFIFLDGELTRLPTRPWADKARYIPGQVYRPAHVPADDVNPRPVSSLTPSNGLTGAFTADGKQLMAVVWEPYQELFQGVIACIHSDFRLGGLKPGETKKIRGKIYIMPADIKALVKRYEADFPEQVKQAAASRDDS